MNFLQPTLLCLAHLGWDNVWQRPQQILSRLARYYRVIYVNEPFLTSAEGEPHLRSVASVGNVSAWQPFFPERKEVLEQWRENYLALVKKLLLDQELVHQNGVLSAARPLILWFYTPTPYYFLEHFPADLVVYDVMDELANFKHAAADLRQRESILLEQTDLVFAGGRTLSPAASSQNILPALFNPQPYWPHLLAICLPLSWATTASLMSALTWPYSINWPGNTPNGPLSW